MFPTSLKELAFCAIIIAAGGILYLLGSIALGHREGGRRAVLLGFGFGLGVLGWFVIRHFWSSFHAQQYPEALFLYIGCVLAVFATIVIGVSIFGSDRRVKEYFDAVLGIQ